MVGWRDIKRKALGQVHETFAIPAVYLTHAAGTPIPVRVRLHLKPITVEQGGDFSDGASMQELSSRAVFEKSAALRKVMPRAYLIFGNSEIYITGASRPEKDGYVSVEISEVAKDDFDRLIANVDLAHPAWQGVLT